jgi:CDP-6-deoxy-D-xylo-4-hexulose-3-dehydrase
MRRNGKGYRVVGELKSTDFILNNTFWIGVYPGMTEEMLSYMISVIKEFVSCYKV